MFILRSFGGYTAQKSPLRALLLCSAAAAVGLFWLGGIKAAPSSPLVGLLAATLFGFGKTFLWPTMLGVTSELFPRGGALTLSLMGGVGMASVAVTVPIMGACVDHYGQGAALQMMAVPAGILVVIFLGLLVYFRNFVQFRPQITGTLR
jgi:predicted MFS family arabinose efflux permease